MKGKDDYKTFFFAREAVLSEAEPIVCKALGIKRIGRDRLILLLLQVGLACIKKAASDKEALLYAYYGILGIYSKSKKQNKKTRVKSSSGKRRVRVPRSKV